MSPIPQTSEIKRTGFKLPEPRTFGSLAALVAAIGEFLMLYYNRRLTNTRDDALKTKKHLESLGVDLSFTGTPAKEKDLGYDWQELVIFTVILTLSPFIVLLVSCVASGHP